MARIRLVVTDSAKAQAAKVRAYHLHPRLQAQVARESPPAVGTVHTEMDDTCPEGLPNCRNCGDPQHADECKAAGHCPDCGTKHGVAPDSVLAANGLTMEAAP